MLNFDIQQNIDYLVNEIGSKNPVVIKNFFIGKIQPLDAAIIYIDGLVNRAIIDRDILMPLMIHVQENIAIRQDITRYLSKSYITVSNSKIETDIKEITDSIKRGKSVILIDGVSEAIIIETSGAEYRSISDPQNDTSIRGSRQSFVESLETNLSLIRRGLKDNNLAVERFIVGKRSQLDGVLLYIKDVADIDLANKILNRINAIDKSNIVGTGFIQQLIEDYSYSVFPQTISTERPEVAIANLVEGKMVILLEGSPNAISAPTSFAEFFQALDDYEQRTLVSSFVRIVRLIAVFIVVTLPSMYLTLMKFNAELIPVKFITPIIQSRIGIALTPFMEILSMEIIVEFLREGGLRLPSKVGQTLSVVGGIIIGDTAVRSKIVSPTTLFIIGVTVISTFLIPNYDMAISIRLIRFPMLILANFLGIYGIGIGWYLMLGHLCSLDSFGVPYLELKSSDMKDIFIRAPIWKFNKRPEAVPNTNPIRQTRYRKIWKKRK